MCDVSRCFSGHAAVPFGDRLGRPWHGSREYLPRLLHPVPPGPFRGARELCLGAPELCLGAVELRFGELEMHFLGAGLRAAVGRISCCRQAACSCHGVKVRGELTACR
ncbi:hypothetical protein P3T39_002213 [Kitasatospora sp. GP82]|nr:hypothetical protein [Kitasatospora sp. GP82]